MPHSQKRKLLLVDVDCGTDDAQAIMMALAAPSVKVLAITCVGGNTPLDNVCKNVLRVLKICNRSDLWQASKAKVEGTHEWTETCYRFLLGPAKGGVIDVHFMCEPVELAISAGIPVYRGMDTPILGEHVHASDFHGKDGLGDVPDASAPGIENIQKEHAVDMMIKIATKHAGEISLIATGPLTNLAMAVRMDPNFPKKLKDLYIMGGNMESRGNTTACGEFNFVADPEAAYMVLSDFTCPTYIATWEHTCRSKLSWEWYDKWVKMGTEKAQFIKKIYAHSMQYSRSEKEVKEMVSGAGFVSCDAYAMAAAIDKSTVTSSLETAVTVELNGKFTRGMMVLDLIDELKKQNKAFVMNGCNMDKFKVLMENSVK